MALTLRAVRDTNTHRLPLERSLSVPAPTAQKRFINTTMAEVDSHYRWDACLYYSKQSGSPRAKMTPLMASGAPCKLHFSNVKYK